MEARGDFHVKSENQKRIEKSAQLSFCRETDAALYCHIAVTACTRQYAFKFRCGADVPRVANRPVKYEIVPYLATKRPGP